MARKLWTDEERAAAGQRLKQAREQKRLLKQTAQVEPDFDKSVEEVRADTINVTRVTPFTKTGGGKLATETVSVPELFNVLSFVSRMIRTRNANGRMSEKFCRLCSQARLLHEPCRHTEIWRLAR